MFLHIFLIVNTHRNILRMYPHSSSTLSKNYENAIYFRDGTQMVAINQQYLSNSFLLNRAIFIPPIGIPISPALFEESGLPSAWIGDNRNPLAYRLKPLWLLGLIQYPELYKLTLNVVQIGKYINESFEELDIDSFYVIVQNTLNSTKISTIANESIILDNINVTVPFFIVSLFQKKIMSKNKIFKTGVEIPWIRDDPTGSVMFDIYLLDTTYNNYNNVTVNGTDDDCINDTIFNTLDKLTIRMNYSWQPAISAINNEHKEHLKIYNDVVTETRNDELFKSLSVIDFLNDINIMNLYQSVFYDNLKREYIDST